MVTETIDEVEQILDKHADEEGALIQVLLDVQAKYNWLPKDILRQISDRLEIPLTYVYRVASFYKAMSLTPVGRHQVSVCLGTACHVRGGPKILEYAELAMGIKAGETTEDMKFTLKRVNCLGCCALGPVMTVDGETHGKLAPAQVKEILGKYD
jgi:NADH-quinone oxidoreductase subunit E